MMQGFIYLLDSQRGCGDIQKHKGPYFNGLKRSAKTQNVKTVVGST